MDSIPPVELHAPVLQQSDDFILQANSAQYKGSDFSNVVAVARSIPLEKAFEIARSNENVDYFVYVKGYCMVLEMPSDYQHNPANDPFGLVCYTPFIFDNGDKADGYCRIFHHGDAIFFNKEGMWLGSAPGLADTYIKQN